MTMANTIPTESVRRFAEYLARCEEKERAYIESLPEEVRISYLAAKASFS